jgi:CheY-like chemotaxis protein
MNLLMNAVKFTKEGSISLRGQVLEDNRIAILVTDSGPGISKADQATLFQPFERFNTSEQAAGGTGLGLAISYEYARLLKGDITVVSSPGQGSCFRFEFPAPISQLAPTPAGSRRQVTGLAPGQGEVRVLVVDDQASNRKLLRAMLAPLGFIVDEACDGAEAIARFHAARPRIVLMDLIMPGMDGVEATRIIRQAATNGPCAIIGISASALVDEKRRFIDAGIDAFIAKPILEQGLFAAITRHGGVELITEELATGATAPLPLAKDFTLDKQSDEWCDALRKALMLGNITKIRRLGEEARATDPLLADFLLQRVALYDLNELKKLIDLGLA